MTPKLMLFLVIGTIMMGIPICFVAKKYAVRIWKACIVTILLTVFGAIGTFLMYYIENGRFGGLSFYGAVFLVPIIFPLISLIVRVPYDQIMDFCAIGECVMLALMKIHCRISGCCIGRVLYTTENGVLVRFPSREAEFVVALVLFVILLCCALEKKHCGQLYAWYLILYGSTRFILNIFRDAWVTKTTLLPMGNIWSLLAIVVGIGWLCIVCKRVRKGSR